MIDATMMSEKEIDELAKTLASDGSLLLHEKHPDLVQLRIGLHWDALSLSGQAVDLDLGALMLNDDGLVRSATDFIFYNHKQSPCSAIRHLGDDRKGDRQEGQQDDETLLIDLSRVPADIMRIEILVSIHKANARAQNFGLVRGAGVRLFNEGKGGELMAKLDLSEDVALATAAIVGELQRRGARDWAYVRVGLGDENGLAALLSDYGLAS